MNQHTTHPQPPPFTSWASTLGGATKSGFFGLASLTGAFATTSDGIASSPVKAVSVNAVCSKRKSFRFSFVTASGSDSDSAFCSALGSASDVIFGAAFGVSASSLAADVVEGVDDDDDDDDDDEEEEACAVGAAGAAAGAEASVSAGVSAEATAVAIAGEGSDATTVLPAEAGAKSIAETIASTIAGARVEATAGAINGAGLPSLSSLNLETFGRRRAAAFGLIESDIVNGMGWLSVSVSSLAGDRGGGAPNTVGISGRNSDNALFRLADVGGD
jgi:hypothetical protein